MNGKHMEIEVNNTKSGDESYTLNMTILHKGVKYKGDVVLYSYGGGLEEGDMELGWFEDAHGNLLDEDLIDRSKVFETALQNL